MWTDSSCHPEATLNGEDVNIVFAIGESPHEEMDRSAIDQIKLELRQQPFSVQNLQLQHPGASRMFLLSDSNTVR